MTNEPPKPTRFLAPRPMHLTEEQMKEIQVTGTLPRETMLAVAQTINSIRGRQVRTLKAALTRLDELDKEDPARAAVLAEVIRLAEIVVGLRQEEE